MLLFPPYCVTKQTILLAASWWREHSLNLCYRLEEMVVYVCTFLFTGKEMELRPLQFILRCGE